MSLWNRLRAISIFLRLVMNPNRTDLIFKGIDIAAADPNDKTLKEIERHVLANAEFRKQYDDRYMPKTPRLSDLAQMPVGSFGCALYKHMSDNGLDFDLFPHLKSDRPVHYLTDRIYQDHDLWHVLLGLGVEVEDELGVQAFGVAQYRSPIGTLIIAGGLLHLLGKDPMRAVRAIGKIAEIYSVGRRAPFMLSIKLHELFPRPLNEVREICGIVEIPREFFPGGLDPLWRVESPAASTHVIR